MGKLLHLPVKPAAPRGRLDLADVEAWTGRTRPHLHRLARACRRLLDSRRLVPTPAALFVAALALAAAGCTTVVAPKDYHAKAAPAPTPADDGWDGGWREAGTTPVAHTEPAPAPAAPTKSSAFEAGQAALAAGDFAAARSHFQQVLTGAGTADEQAPARAGLRRASEQLFFSGGDFPGAQRHTVQPGETLSHIAVKARSSSELLARQNGIKDPGKIRAGQTLRVLAGPPKLAISKGRHVLDFSMGEVLVFQYEIGCGRANLTPTGTFTIGEKRVKPVWWKNGKRIPYGSPENALGERWLGFQNTAQHQGYGLHGTNDPASIGADKSEGCVRLRNEDVIELYDLVPRNTQVIIRD